MERWLVGTAKVTRLFGVVAQVEMVCGCGRARARVCVCVCVCVCVRVAEVAVIPAPFEASPRPGSNAAYPVTAEGTRRLVMRSCLEM